MDTDKAMQEIENERTTHIGLGDILVLQGIPMRLIKMRKTTITFKLLCARERQEFYARQQRDASSPSSGDAGTSKGDISGVGKSDEANIPDRPSPERSETVGSNNTP